MAANIQDLISDPQDIGLQPNPGPKRRMVFTPAEDNLLRSLVQAGNLQWHEIQQMMPRFTARMLKERYDNYLRPGLSFDPYTYQEFCTLVVLHWVFKNNWSRIASIMTDRSPASIKNQWRKFERNRHKMQPMFLAQQPQPGQPPAIAPVPLPPPPVAPVPLPPPPVAPVLPLSPVEIPPLRTYDMSEVFTVFDIDDGYDYYEDADQ